MKTETVMLVLFLVSSVISCNKLEKNGIVLENIDTWCTIDTAFLNRYLFDIRQVVERENSSSFQDAFLSFRKLEAITSDIFALDEVTYTFLNDMHRLDTLNYKLTHWISWLEENKCKFDSTKVSLIYEKVNEWNQNTRFNEEFLQKERQLYGLEQYDDSKDSILIHRVKTSMEENTLRW
ncbi:MAG: hypothetical protein R2828_35730 [Saprospiraceae bacterium]